VHAGGRGKGGGVRLVRSVEELAEAAADLIGSRLVTRQTGPQGLPVSAVLVEQTVALSQQYYLGMLVDRSRERIAIMASAAGGVDIESVAASDPAAIHTELVVPAAGLQPYQCRNLAFALGLQGAQVAAFTRLTLSACRKTTISAHDSINVIAVRVSQLIERSNQSPQVSGTPSSTLASLVFQASYPGVTSMGIWVIESPCKAAKRSLSMAE